MDAFDADVLVYACVPDHPLGERVRALFAESGPAPVGVGSTLLIPELLTKPTRDGSEGELRALELLLSRLELLAVDRFTAQLAVVLGAEYGLRAADATHLATAIRAGADRFITNNRRDFGSAVEEIDIIYPDGLRAT
ncbi:MAG: type II toxin-antitoxin system VapC family toxin [Acidimicrobiia bacterium]